VEPQQIGIPVGGQVAEPGERLAELFDRHSAGAFRLAFLLTGDRSAAEEIVQDAFVKICGRFQDLADPNNFGGYLYRTVTNLSRSHGRRLGLRSRALQRLPSQEVSPDPHLDRREALWRALLQLPIRQRAAIFFRYYEDLSEAQTADAMACSIEAVKSLTTRAMKKLREVIEDE
jgi:RNA polymerase sigma-70 factor (sigma-E family)